MNTMKYSGCLQRLIFISLFIVSKNSPHLSSCMSNINHDCVLGKSFFGIIKLRSTNINSIFIMPEKANQ
jgi:hypothetical protein